MAVAAEVIAGILVGILLVVTALTLFVGFMGTVLSEGIERCARCGHWTLGYHGMTHPEGCPGTLCGHAAHVCRGAFHRVPLRHH